MAHVLPFPKFRAFDVNGDPLVGGKLYSYEAGTSTPLATYTDFGGLSANTNPVILDANGEASVWIANTSYKFVLTDSDDVVQWTKDNITPVISTAQLADGILTADAAGLLKMADGYLANSTAGRLKMSNGFLSATTDGLAKMAAGFLQATTDGLAKMADGYLSADAAGRAKMADGFLTRAKQAAVGQQTSTSSSTFSMTGTTWTDVTNLSVTITTTGRPVILMLVAATTDPNNSYMQAYRGGVTSVLYSVKFVRDVTDLAQVNVIAGGAAGTIRASAPASAHQHIDVPAAGTYTYKVQGRGDNAATTVEFWGVKLIAFEL